MNSTINSTGILSKVNSSAVAETSTKVLASYYKGFVTSPLLWGGLTIAVVTVLLIIGKQFLDNQETTLQGMLWFIFVHFGVFMVTLIFLLVLDSGEIAILSSL